MVGIWGGLSVDHIVSVNQAPHFFSLGGPGLYAALGARLIEGTDVQLQTTLPAAEPRFAEVLVAAGVDISLCTVVPEVPRIWVLTSPEGRRLVQTAGPSRLEVAEDDEEPGPGPNIEWEPYPGLNALLLCSPQRLPPRADEAAIIGVDPDQRETLARSWEYWEEISVPSRSVLFPSRLQLSLVKRDPIEAAVLLNQRLKVPVIARLDRDGAAAIDAEGTWVVHDDEVGVTDTTGAGDAMAGATVSALAAGCDAPTATAFGVSAARYALADWGHFGLVAPSPLSAPLPGVRTRRAQG
jgi:sugar/nucleoside kinase (ribokinase family)